MIAGKPTSIVTSAEHYYQPEQFRLNDALSHCWTALRQWPYFCPRRDVGQITPAGFGLNGAPQGVTATSVR